MPTINTIVIIFTGNMNFGNDLWYLFRVYETALILNAMAPRLYGKA